MTVAAHEVTDDLWSGLAAPHRSRAEQLAAELADRIRDQGLGAGTALGTLDELREHSRLARPTVSEAVRLLRDRGLVEIRPGRGGGLFVAESTPVVRLRRTLLTVAEEPGAARDAIELRDHLELLVDLGAAGHHDADDIADLRSLVRTMGSAPDWSGFMTANWALHRRIAALCPNTMAAAVYVGTLGHLADASASLAGDGGVHGGVHGEEDRDEDAAAYRRHRQQVHVELVEAVASGHRTRVRSAVARHNAPAPRPRAGGRSS